jgi:chaperone required for assembly of F1-ATPase
MKRFYKIVAVAPAPAPAEDGFIITLDGRTLKSPAKQAFVLPNLGLAEAVAAEWDAQGDKILPDSMPLTQLASTAVDRIPPERAGVIAGTAAYAETDLLCYRAEEPPELVERQARQWQPLLDWAALRYDAVLTVQTGLMPVAQNPQALNAFRAAVEVFDNWRLAALQTAVPACGSLVVGLALLEGRLDAEAAFEVSQLDETFQIEKWGEDAEAAHRRANLRADIAACRRFADLLAGIESPC